MVSHIPMSLRLRSGPRRKMVKGKRRTMRSSKDENAVVSLDGPKGPKDSRLESRVVNGLVGGGSASTTQRDTKITNYFTPSRSPPAADDAELECGTTIEGGSCRLGAEMDNAQLSRTSPPTVGPPTTPTKLLNGHASPPRSPASSLDPMLSPSKRTVCTRSQALKELQLQTSPTALPTGGCLKGSCSNSSTSNTSSQCQGHQPLLLAPVPPCDISAASLPSLPTTPTSPTSPDDASSPQTGPPTPHKIQALNEERLRLDSPLSPSSALSKLKLTLSPKKITFNGKTSKSRRKLAVQPVVRAAPQNKVEKTTISTATKGSTVALPNGEAKAAMRNTHMTEFFPIRRSERKSKTTLLKERQKEIEERILSEEEVGLAVQNFGAKGRGVVTTRHFKKGEFVVEYIGDLIDIREAKDREKRYSQDSSTGCYNYYFTFQNQQYCIDATKESRYLGRLVNHSRNGNLVTKAVEVNGQPHLILLAKRDLEPGTEILYDYGDRSKEALEHHPWLAS